MQYKNWGMKCSCSADAVRRNDMQCRSSRHFGDCCRSLLHTHKYKFYLCTSSVHNFCLISMYTFWKVIQAELTDFMDKPKFEILQSASCFSRQFQTFKRQAHCARWNGLCFCATTVKLFFFVLQHFSLSSTFEVSFPVSNIFSPEKDGNSGTVISTKRERFRASRISVALHPD